MNLQTYRKSSVLLAGAGLLFSGYLGSVRFFSSSCAFDEPCPMFLGYPVCYFGFALFLALFIVSVTSLSGKIKSRWPMVANSIISLMGTLFAGYFTQAELKSILSEGFKVYRLGLPTCAYGAIFFLMILTISLLSLKRRNQSTSSGS